MIRKLENSADSIRDRVLEVSLADLTRMFEVMTRETVNEDLKGLVQKLMPEAIGREIEKACKGIFPLQNVFIRKVKVLKTPKMDLSKLLELHGETTDVCILSSGLRVHSR